MIGAHELELDERLERRRDRAADVRAASYGKQDFEKYVKSLVAPKREP